MESLREDINGEKLYNEYFGISKSKIRDYLEDKTTKTAVKKIFSDAKKGDDMAFKAVASFVTQMAMKQLWNFLGPNRKMRGLRINNGDVDVYLSLVSSALIKTLKDFKPAQYDSVESMVHGFQYFFRGYIMGETKSENRSRASNGEMVSSSFKDNSEGRFKMVHPDQMVNDDGKDAWETTRGEVDNSFEDEDIELKEKFTAFANDKELRGSKHEWNKILAAALSGDTLESIAKDFDIAKNTIRYKLYGEDGLLNKLIRKYDIDLEDLSQLLHNEPDFVISALD